MSETKRPTGGWLLSTGYRIGVEDLPGLRKSLALVVQRDGEVVSNVVAYFRSDEDAALFLAALGE